MEIRYITGKELSKIENLFLLNEIKSLILNVYNLESVELFEKDIHEVNYDIVYLVENNNIIGMGCIVESNLSYGVYELSWGIIHYNFRGKKYGKLLIEKCIELAENKYQKHNKITEVLCITNKKWYLERCGFVEIKKMIGDNEFLMYKEIEEK